MKYKSANQTRRPIKGYADPYGQLIQIAIRLPAPVFKALAGKANEDCQAVSPYIRKLLVHIFNAGQL